MHDLEPGKDQRRANHMADNTWTREVERAAEEAKRVRENAYVPYSGFAVGAAVLSRKTGELYSGCNVENASYGATICAERSAVLQAIAREGAGEFSLLAVFTEAESPVPPCAQCLQVLSEFASADMPVILCSSRGVGRTYRFEELLPHPFNKIP